MQSRLKYVEQNGGVYTPYNQQAHFKVLHEKRFNTVFEGYCTGISLAYIEEIILLKHRAVSSFPTHSSLYFNEDINKQFLLRHRDCLEYQLQYERNPEEFCDIFMRQYSDSLFNEPVRPRVIENFFDVIREQTIFLFNIVYNLQRGQSFEKSDHTLVILHDGVYWRFFDPNYGEAKFTDKANFNQWLRDEMNMGELQVLIKPQQKQAGILSISDLKANFYPYPREKLDLQSQPDFMPRAKL